jgi:hypothetical protein
MKLRDIIKEIIREKVHIQHPTPRVSKDDDLRGYTVTGTELDPETGKSTTHLSAEPSLLKYAKEIRLMKKEMKYFALMDDTSPLTPYFKAEANSIIASLNNAEGKLRDLYSKMKVAGKFKE